MVTSLGYEARKRAQPDCLARQVFFSLYVVTVVHDIFLLSFLGVEVVLAAICFPASSLSYHAVVDLEPIFLQLG